MKHFLTIAAIFVFLCSVARAETELERQVKACTLLAACKIDIPFGTHVVTAPWNLRNKSSLEIRAPLGTAVIWFFADDPVPEACMDTVGSRNILIEGVTFGLGNASKRPGALWVHGRPSDGKSQERLSVANATFSGWFTKCTVALIASENGLFSSVDFENGVPNTTALFLSRENELGVLSPFGPIYANPATMTCTSNVFLGCAFSHEGFVGLVPPAHNDNGFGIVLGTGVFDVLIQGGSTSGGARGGVLRIAGQGNRRIAVVAPNWESKSAKSCIQVDGYAYGLSVDHGLLMADGPALRLNGTIENLSLQPAEMQTTSILKFGPLGKLTGTGLQTNGLGGL